MKRKLNPDKYYLIKSFLLVSLLFLTIIIPLKSIALTSFLSFPTKIDTKQERMNVQTVLNEVMTPSPNLVVDGILGRKSIQAVQAFQDINGLVADGKVGPITRSVLENTQTNTHPNTETNTTLQSNTNTYTLSDCSPGASFSIITGKPCSSTVSTLPTGCTSSTLFSPVTGKSCGNKIPSTSIPTIPVTTVPVVTTSTVVTPPIISSGGGGGGGSSSTSSPSPTCSGSTSQSCTITSGQGIQSRTCTNGTWSNYGTCIITSCNSGYQISGNTCALVAIPDTIKPIITSFSISATSSSLTVPISSFITTDNKGVTGYLLTESSSTPSASFSSWASSKPASYTFSSAGFKTLYAWAKDSSGNVSTGVNDTVMITLTCSGSTTQTCTISNGQGMQSRTCTDGTWANYGTCMATSCNSGYQISGNTCALITIPDTIKPIITSFSISATSSSLTVPISSFITTDNKGVTGYLLTESSSTPSAGSGSWTSSKPTTYTFSSQGSKTLYAWVKDQAGNVSNGVNDTVIITLTITSPTTLNTYYVATNGNDNNPGTITQPWATWQKGFNTAKAGNTVYIRGGTYYPTGTSGSGYISGVYISNHDGTSSSPINIFAYPGEEPILDGSNLTQTVTRFGIFMINSDYWHIKGLSVTNVKQYPNALGVGAFRLHSSNHNTLEQIKSYNNGGSGITLIYDSYDNYILNSDAWGNYDPYSIPTPGNNSDGIEITDITGITMTNTVRGSRMWNNSDDGMDLHRNEGKVIIDNCWAFQNGVTANYPANGFKLGVSYLNPATYQREVTNSIAAYNMASGFDVNSAMHKMKLYNNLAYRNGDYGFQWWSLPANPVGASIFKNNANFGNLDSRQWNSDNAVLIHDHNTRGEWEPTAPAVVSSADFISLDVNELRAPRKSNGDLPDISFGHLASTSDLINAGTNVGFSYNSSAPDIGVFESSYTGSSTTDTTKPNITSFSISATSSSLTVPILSFIANDAVGVTGYKLTETSTVPTLSTPGWTITPSTSYTFSSTGLKTLYAWAKDSSGNVSNGVNDTVTITITITSPTTGKILTTEGTTTNDTTTGFWNGVNILRNTPTTFTYRNNSITSVNSGGYMLQAGDEDVGINNNNLAGEVISGNKFTWNGTDMTSITHGVFTGYQLNATLKYNYLNKVPMGLIRKSNGMTNTSGGVAYNIVNKTNATAVVVKGMNGVNIYNNTFYSDENMYVGPGNGTYRGLIEIYANDNPVSMAPTETKIKNNIFYTKYKIYNIRVVEKEGLVGFESDYNVFYSESGTPIFNYLGSTKTFAEWQALGYDTHSIVINPNFIDFINFVPRTRLDYGTNLGVAWQTGLSTTAVWNVGSSPTMTNQNGTWQVGARIAGNVLGVSTYKFTLLLKYGSSGNEVKELQKILISDGYLSGTPDGIYGILTLKAVKDYQKANGLTPDGIIGPLTREILNK